ncbi:MAG TPA: dihydroorotase [Candidatus Omnitrophica bacterium]|nr:dihydroorotase [Candidatus Omnitrophota bacterium]
MSILIKNGRVIDPGGNIDAVLDILVEDGRISKVAKDITVPAKDMIDASGKIVMPGLVDMHVHLREPGREDKETVSSGSMAAIRGGVTSLLAMPNTTPAIDSAENIRLLKKIIQKTANCNVFIAGSITSGRNGCRLVDVVSLKKEGVLAITDDGSSVDSEEVMSEALKNANKEKLLVISHCEDRSLANGGVMNLGYISTQLGLRGISNGSEYKRVARDIELAQKTGAAIHIAHISCRESVELVAAAKKKGLHVSAEAAPHHFALCDEELMSYDTNLKMNPPLRSKDDVAAIRQGLTDGTIDAIASDHAPHTENEKEIEFDRAEFGVIGLETELAVSITELVDKGLLSWLELAKRLSFNPSRILGINKGTLSAGSDADIIIIDPSKEWKVAAEGLVSKSKNSAFLGRTLKGVVEYTICAGKVVYQQP